jgi:hypothetical protein
MKFPIYLVIWKNKSHVPNHQSVLLPPNFFFGDSHPTKMAKTEDDKTHVFCHQRGWRLNQQKAVVISATKTELGQHKMGFSPVHS